jgi:opacity protein-like surface antigen
MMQTDNRVSCVGCSQNPWSQGTSTASHLGMIGGGGAEWLIGQYLSLKAEYLLADLGMSHHTFNGTSASGVTETTTGSRVFVYNWDAFDHDLKFSMVRLGVNVRFH